MSNHDLTQLKSRYYDKNHWFLFFDSVKRLLNSKKLFEIFPDYIELDKSETVKGINHKNVFLHTVEVLDNLMHIIDSLTDEEKEAVNIKALVLATALHDIGKARTKVFDKQKNTWTYYDHEKIGAVIVAPVLKKLNFKAADIKFICHIIEFHQLPGQLTDISDKGLRRLLKKCGTCLKELLLLSRADCTSNNPMKKLAAKQKIDDLETKIKEFEKAESNRLFKIVISPSEIKNLLQIEDWKIVEKYSFLLKDLVFNGVIENEIETLQKAIEILHKQER